MSKEKDGKKKRKEKDKYQIEKEWKSVLSILKVVSDGKEHQYKDIKKATGLSDPTLTKFLKRFTKELKLMKHRWDTSTYPHASYYKPEQELIVYSKRQVLTENLSQLIEPTLSESKDPLIILEWIHIMTFRQMIEILRQLQKNRNLEPKLDFLMDILVWEPFKVLTLKVLESTKKIIDEIDFDKLQKDELEIWKDVIDNMPSSLGE